jgi:hypothetical protein
MINATARTIKAVVKIRQGYQPLPHDTLIVAVQDTAFMGHYAAFSPPTPWEYIDSIKIYNVNDSMLSSISEVDSSWVKKVVKADYPQNYQWFVTVH